MEPQEPIVLFDGTRDRWVFAIPLFFIGVLLMREGLRLQRTGHMERKSFQYQSELRRATILRALLGQSPPQELSEQYIRTLGAGEEILGACLTVAALWQILRAWI
jgi:hypothetical protein